MINPQSEPIEVQVKQGYYSEEQYQHDLKIMAQEAYCTTHKIPNFADNGRCYSCYRNVFDDMTLEEAGSKHITGCPYCHTSFCD